MDQKITIRIPQPGGQSHEVHHFNDLDNARDFLTRRIREEAKTKKETEEQVNAVPGE